VEECKSLRPCLVQPDGGREREGEEQLVLLEQRAADVLVQAVREVVDEEIQPRLTGGSFRTTTATDISSA